jgi:hypothetical protein
MSKSWEQILGGFATNTLTAEEKRLLFEAALDDQTLFDALADEEALRALLTDPQARQRILDSLQASGNPKGMVAPHSPQLRWFRQPSSLAWAGSIAAMGLALIFGWQMEVFWGPVVQEELQIERSVSEDKDEMAIPSQLSRIKARKPLVHERQKKPQSEPEPIASLPGQSPVTESPAKAKASKDRGRMDEAPVAGFSKRAFRKMVKKEHLPKAKEPDIQGLESAMDQSFSQEYRLMTPSVGDTVTRKKTFQQLPQAPAFVHQMPRSNARSSTSARELFFAKKGSQAHEREAIGSRRAQQLFGGMSSEKGRALQKNSLVLEKTQEAVLDDSVLPTRGIRYSFVHGTPDGKDDAIDIEHFSGSWANLRLGITSNVTAYLYVLTDLENGKWKLMSPESQTIPRSSDGAIEVKAYQPVTFSLSRITNKMGRPVVSAVTVLLSSRQILDLGSWLGDEKRQEQLEGRFRQHVDQSFFVIDRKPKPETPFRVEIPLVQ